MKKENIMGRQFISLPAKAAEYGEWACNFHIVFKLVRLLLLLKSFASRFEFLWVLQQLEKGFKDEQDAIAVFKNSP